MSNAEHRFAGVTEWTMPDIVEQQCATNQATGVVTLAFAREKIRIATSELVECSGAHCERTKCMRESRVFGSGKGQICEPELAQATHALHCGRVEESRLVGLELDEVMYRVKYPLQRT